MDYDIVEEIAIKAKSGDKNAKEALINAFKPFILNFSGKTFITGYEKSDIENECYRILLKSLNKYDLTSHKFVAYGTNSIKNGIYDLIRKRKLSKKSGASFTTVSLNDDLGNSDINIPVTDPILNLDNKLILNKALNSLESSEKDLINFLFYKNKSLKEYSEKHNMNYKSCLRKKKRILSKLSSKLLNWFLKIYFTIINLSKKSVTPWLKINHKATRSILIYSIIK